MALTDDELAEIAARSAAATSGPWWAWVEGRDGLGGDTFIGRGVDGARHPDLYLSTDPGERVIAEDHDFIAHARQDVPALVAEVRRLQGLMNDAQPPLASVAMTDGSPQQCQRCQRPVLANADLYDVFERMHWSCFHYEVEHDGDPDAACGDPSCPARAFDLSPPPTWEDRGDA